jgi:hypothetical protein
MHDLVPVIPAVVGMAQAEADAVNALATFLTSPEGRQSSEDDLKLWLIDRGWPPSKLRAWTERISAYLALASPDDGDPRVLTSRFSVRLERLAHRSEEMNDMKHAIEATKAQATLHKIGGFAPASSPANIQVNITNGNAHLVSDEELLKVANATVVPDADPLLA